MALRTRDTVRCELHSFLSDGREHRVHEYVDRLADRLELAWKERNEAHLQRGQYVFDKNVMFARLNLLGAPLH